MKRRQDNKIYNAYYDMAILISRRHFKNYCDIEASAIFGLSKVFIAFEKFDAIDLEELRGYAYRIIKNASISEVRKLNTFKKHYILNDDFYSYTISCEEYNSDCKDELIDTVISKVDELPEVDKKIIHMKFNEDKSYREMSAVLNVTENSMGTRYSRVINKLKAKLA